MTAPDPSGTQNGFQVDEHLRSRDECCRDGFRSNRANGAVPVDKSCVVIQDDVARVTIDLDDNRTRFETPRLTVDALS